METLREKIIGKLTNYRQLTSADVAELDTIGIALDLNENDPFWGQIIWLWATLPRQEKFDISLRALTAKIRNDMQTLLAAQPTENNSIGGLVDDSRLDEIKALLKTIVDRPASAPAQAQVTIDQNALQSSITAAMSGKKAMVSVQDFFSVFKDAMREVVGWTTAGVAALLIGVCLYIGYSVGEKSQASTDSAAFTDLKKQNAGLEQQITTLTKLVGRR
jgi:hypothetical protein